MNVTETMLVNAIEAEIVSVNDLPTATVMAHRQDLGVIATESLRRQADPHRHTAMEIIATLGPLPQDRPTAATLRQASRSLLRLLAQHLNRPPTHVQATLFLLRPHVREAVGVVVSGTIALATSLVPHPDEVLHTGTLPEAGVSMVDLPPGLADLGLVLPPSLLRSAVPPTVPVPRTLGPNVLAATLTDCQRKWQGGRSFRSWLIRARS